MKMSDVEKVDVKEYLKENERLTLMEKLYLLHWKSGAKSHLGIVNTHTCEGCKGKECNLICPADVWRLEEGRGVPIIKWENCVECGACRIACPYDNIKWEWQQGGKGVSYKFG